MGFCGNSSYYSHKHFYRIKGVSLDVDREVCVNNVHELTTKKFEVLRMLMEVLL